MKRIVKSFMALCAGVMTLCAASSLFVSCDTFDDTALRTEIDALKGQLSGISERLQALEELTARVDALYTLKFQVNDKYELQYSFDGGANWTSTGVILTEGCEDVSLVDNGDSVTITVGDQSFTIQKPEEIVFEIKSGKLYFAPEVTKAVNVVTSGIEDVTVMNVPKGWYADFNADGQLEITAPSVELDRWGDLVPDDSYNATGYVKIHACSEEGSCMVGKIYVEVTSQPITLNFYAGKYEVVSTGASVYFGASTKSELEADIKAFLEAWEASDYDFEWENEVSPYGDPATGDLKTLLGVDALVAGTEYVLWAIDYLSLDDATLEDFFLAYYTPTEVVAAEIEEKRSAYDIHVSVKVVGAESYLALGAPSEDVEYMIENVLYELSGMGGGFGPLDTKAVRSAFAKTYEADYEGSLALIGTESFSIAPATKYTLVVLPLDGRPSELYTADDFFTKEFQSGELAAGGTVTGTVEQITKYIPYEGAEEKDLNPYTELGLKVTPSSDAWQQFYFVWVDETVYTTDMGNGDAELVMAYLTDPENYAVRSLSPDEKFNGVFTYTGLNPDTAKRFVSVFVDNDDKYGEIVTASLKTEKITKVEMDVTYTSNLNEEDVLKGETLEVVLTGGASYKYFLGEVYSYYNMYANETPESMSDKIFMGSYESEDVVDGKITIESTYGSSYFLAILPYDETGAPATEAIIINYSCAFALPNLTTDALVSEPTVVYNVPTVVVDETVENYYENIPEDGLYLSFYKDDYGTAFYYNGSYTVTPAEGTEVISLMVENSDIKGLTDLQKAEGLWGQTLNTYYTVTHTGLSNVERTFNGSGEAALECTILLTWKVGENYYYKEVSLDDEFKAMYTTLATAAGLDIPSAADGYEWVLAQGDLGTTDAPAASVTKGTLN